MLKTLTHINELVTLKNAYQKDGRHLLPEDLSIIADGAIVFDEQKILWVGHTNNIPQEFAENSTAFNMKGHVITPEIVDSHTHLIFAGDRSREYSDRLNGKSYEQIAKEGGGILYTTKMTNEASPAELFDLACQRIEQIHSYGVGTIEIKSGYGLNYEKELEISKLIYQLKLKYSPQIQIFNTCLAAHAIPPGYGSSEKYIHQVVLPLIKDLANLEIIDAVDIFHEKNYFTDDDVKTLFKEAQKYHLPVKIHADELNSNSGAKLAMNDNALSADHLLKISDEDISNLEAHRTVATLLPGTALFLGKNLAPARKILDAGAKVALASDYNPGSCHCDNLLMIAAMSAPLLHINQAELWASLTLNASHALGMFNQGALVTGLKPRFSVFKTKTLSQITYNWGQNLSVPPIFTHEG